jgi:hypothetical protein
MSTETPFFQDPSGKMEQPSIGSKNSQFRGGVQGHTWQLTTFPVPDRVDKIPACF